MYCTCFLRNSDRAWTRRQRFIFFFFVSPTWQVNRWHLLFSFADRSRVASAWNVPTIAAIAVCLSRTATHKLLACWSLHKWSPRSVNVFPKSQSVASYLFNLFVCTFRGKQIALSIAFPRFIYFSTFFVRRALSKSGDEFDWWSRHRRRRAKYMKELILRHEFKSSFSYDNRCWNCDEHAKYIISLMSEATTYYASRRSNAFPKRVNLLGSRQWDAFDFSLFARKRRQQQQRRRRSFFGGNCMQFSAKRQMASDIFSLWSIHAANVSILFFRFPFLDKQQMFIFLEFRYFCHWQLLERTRTRSAKIYSTCLLIFASKQTDNEQTSTMVAKRVWCFFTFSHPSRRFIAISTDNSLPLSLSLSTFPLKKKSFSFLLFPSFDVFLFSRLSFLRVSDVCFTCFLSRCVAVFIHFCHETIFYTATTELQEENNNK